jgi:hypothetical protein
MPNAVLRLKAGTYKLRKPMQIGSMQLVGARNFVVFSAFSTLYRKSHDLLVGYVFKKHLVTPAADVIDISATYDGGLTRC